MASGGNTVHMENGAKIDLEDYSSANVLTIYADESRIRINGAVTGGLQATVRSRGELVIMEGGSLSVPSGRTLTLGGTALAGFDGTAGGTASLTISGTLKFEIGTKFQVNNCPTYQGIDTEPAGVNTKNMPKAIGTPRCGDCVTGATTGTTAIAGRAVSSSGSAFTALFDDVVGSGFVNDEFMRGPFRSGVHGLTAPNLTANVTLASGSTIQVGQVDLLAPGTYDLIVADSLTDNGATLPDNVAVVGNKLVLTVSE